MNLKLSTLPHITKLSVPTCLSLWILGSSLTLAHDGRRLEVIVVSGQLVAQGVNTGPDDGAPPVRPYENAIHGHWTNVPSLNSGTSSQPGYDVTQFVSGELAGYRLDLDWVGSYTWIDSSQMPGHGMTLEPDMPVTLHHAAMDEEITIFGPQNDLMSHQLGTMTLIPSIPFGGVWISIPTTYVTRLRMSTTMSLSFDSAPSQQSAGYLR